MERFKIGNLDDWETLTEKDVVQFHASERGRSLKFLLNASGPVAIYASSSNKFDDEKLVAFGQGLLEVECTIQKNTFFRFHAAKGTAVVMRRTARDYTVRQMYKEKFVNLDFERNGNPEFDRMMLLMQHNQNEFKKSIAADQEEAKKLRDELLKLHEKSLSSSLEEDEQSEVVEDEQSETGSPSGNTDGVPQQDK